MSRRGIYKDPLYMQKWRESHKQHIKNYYRKVQVNKYKARVANRRYYGTLSVEDV